jgi:UDP-4-amino-4,6-dideoxy-N-acetyl-beta-L-altrosamine transaminase
MIPYGRQDISQSDIDAVVNVLQSDFLTQGPMVPAFEGKVANYCQAQYAVAVNSATSALHIACLALGLGPGDWLWTSPITFVASANCALYCGAKVDFVDIDPQTYNMSVSALEEKLISASKNGKLPKIVIPVHLSGQSCDMEAIYALSKKYDFNVIEDASHAIGATYQGRSVGGCRYSDITVFSFHPVKIITTAEGGMATTNDQNLAKRMELFRSHGITRDATVMARPSDGPWYYEQIDLGFNYRMTELQAALGISQMDRLTQFVARRRELAARYDYLLSGLPILLPWQSPDAKSAFHLYIIRLKLSEINKTHLEVFNILREEAIGVNLHYIPVYKHPFYKSMGFQSSDWVHSENYYSNTISIPIYYGLTNEMQDRVVAAIHESIG